MLLSPPRGEELVSFFLKGLLILGSLIPSPTGTGDLGASSSSSSSRPPPPSLCLSRSYLAICRLSYALLDLRNFFFLGLMILGDDSNDDSASIIWTDSATFFYRIMFLRTSGICELSTDSAGFLYFLRILTIVPD